jgi:hypothetical protein
MSSATAPKNPDAAVTRDGAETMCDTAVAVGSRGRWQGQGCEYRAVRREQRAGDHERTPPAEPGRSRPDQQHRCDDPARGPEQHPARQVRADPLAGHGDQRELGAVDQRVRE